MKAFSRAGRIVLTIGLVVLAYAAYAAETKRVTGTVDAASLKLPPVSQQYAMQEELIAIRHAMLLDMMRRHNISLWIVITEEFHPDPLVELVITPRPIVGNRDVFIFIDNGKCLGKIAANSYSEEHLKRFFDSPPEELKSAKEVLAELVKVHNPKTIGVSIGGKRGVMHSLTHDAYLFILDAIGKDAAARIVSAADLIEEVADTRLPEERAIYDKLVAITENLAWRALSAEVITPGKTTAGDVRRWLYDRVGEAGGSCWFEPDLRIQRKGMKSPEGKGFLSVAPESMVIERGDLIHLDFGIKAVGLSTDWQKMAYVLREGENDVPEGLKTALARTNRLQDALCQTSRPYMTAGDVYDDVMAEMKKHGIKAKIYSHPLGPHGHGLGASIDFRAAQKEELSRPNKKLRPGSYIAIELNTSSKVSEWDGQEVFIMEEDPAYLTSEGWRFFIPRQEVFYLIR